MKKKRNFFGILFIGIVLMIVVAVVVVAMVVIPSFTQYQNRAKAVEAKLNVGMIYQ